MNKHTDNVTDVVIDTQAANASKKSKESFYIRLSTEHHPQCIAATKIYICHFSIQMDL